MKSSLWLAVTLLLFSPLVGQAATLTEQELRTAAQQLVHDAGPPWVGHTTGLTIEDGRDYYLGDSYSQSSMPLPRTCLHVWTVDLTAGGEPDSSSHCWGGFGGPRPAHDVAAPMQLGPPDGLIDEVRFSWLDHDYVNITPSLPPRYWIIAFAADAPLAFEQSSLTAWPFQSTGHIAIGIVA